MTQQSINLQCPICLNCLVKPITISCGHNFCEPCIKDKNFKELLPLCPICRQEIRIKPKYYNVNLLLDKIIKDRYGSDQNYMLRYNSYQKIICDKPNKNLFWRIISRLKKILKNFFREIKQKYHYIVLVLLLIFVLRVKINIFNLEVPEQYKNKAIQMMNKVKDEATIDFKFLLFSQFIRILFSSLMIR